MRKNAGESDELPGIPYGEVLSVLPTSHGIVSPNSSSPVSAPSSMPLSSQLLLCPSASLQSVPTTSDTQMLEASRTEWLASKLSLLDAVNESIRCQEKLVGHLTAWTVTDDTSPPSTTDFQLSTLSPSTQKGTDSHSLIGKATTTSTWEKYKSSATTITRRTKTATTRDGVRFQMSESSLESGSSLGILMADGGDTMFSFVRLHTAFVQWWAKQRKEPKRKGMIARIVYSTQFAVVCMLVIVIQALYTAYQTNKEMSRRAPADKSEMWIDLPFIAFYTVEMVLKISVHRKHFFCNHEMGWNCFDFGLVVEGLVSFLLTATIQIDNQNSSFLRILRLLKLSKIVRVLRAVRFLKDLRVMVTSILSSVSSLFWASMTLGIILYVFGVLFVQGMTLHFFENEVVDPDLAYSIVRLFGSVEQAMLTLYMCGTSGFDWGDVYKVVAVTGGFNCFVFVFFILFFNFAVVNILTGIFMEKALANAQPDRDEQAMHHRHAEAAEAEVLREAFYSMDLDDSGTISLEEFEDKTKDPRFNSFLATLGIRVEDATMFFKMLVSVSGEEDVPIDDFVDHCTHMKGNATSIDMHNLSYEVRIIHRMLDWLTEQWSLCPDRVCVPKALVKTWSASLNEGSARKSVLSVEKTSTKRKSRSSKNIAPGNESS